MQWVSQGFHDQTEQCIRNGIRCQSHIKTNWLMPASYRDGAGQTDESPDIPHSFSFRWECCDGEKCPRVRALAGETDVFNEATHIRLHICEWRNAPAELKPIVALSEESEHAPSWKWNRLESNSVMQWLSF